MIMTVNGPIPASEMGFTHMHEHLYVADTPAAAKNPALRIDDEARSLEELMRFRQAGGRTIVDCQPVGAGRDIFALRRMGEAGGVHIVSVTGYHMPMFYPEGHWIFTECAEALRDRFLRELVEGVPGPEGARAFPGAVKAAIGRDGPEGRFGTCLRAAAGAAARAKTPLILHTECGAGAVEAAGICESEGLDPARLAVCHVDRQAADYAPHEAVARTGAYLEYDTIARHRYHDDASEVALIRHMLDRGHGRRLLMSLDTTAARMTAYGGAPGLDYVLKRFVPMLAGAGVSGADIAAMTLENPRRLFKGA